MERPIKVTKERAERGAFYYITGRCLPWLCVKGTIRIPLNTQATELTLILRGMDIWDSAGSVFPLSSSINCRHRLEVQPTSILAAACANSSDTWNNKSKGTIHSRASLCLKQPAGGQWWGCTIATRKLAWCLLVWAEMVLRTQLNPKWSGAASETSFHLETTKKLFNKWSISALESLSGLACFQRESFMSVAHVNWTASPGTVCSMRETTGFSPTIHQVSLITTLLFWFFKCLFFTIPTND